MGKKRENILVFFGIAVLIVAFNIICSFFFFRIDLTAEKRYTLSPSTRTLLKGLEDVVYVKVYLDGNLPPDFSELSLSMRLLILPKGRVRRNLVRCTANCTRRV